MDAPSLTAPSASLTRRRVELALLYGLGPALLALGPRWLVSVCILAGGIAATAALLADPTFERRALWGGAAARPALAGVLARTAAAGALGLVLVVALAPGPLFPLPKQHPVFWGLLMVLYPISAFAQEVLYRTFFFHRYGALFARTRARVVVNGVLFGWAHLAVNNVLAVVLAGAAGLLFASTYERTRSTALVTLEHALYGDLVFTVGIGHLFYSSARWLAH
jgi:membrane protease YdiL (CAAX protease family)